MKRSVTFIIAVLAVIITIPAFAGSNTGTLSVTASVATVCTVTSTPVAFGAYDPIITNAAAALNATGTLTVTCTRGTASTVWVGLNPGSNAASAVGTTRAMSAAGPVYLSYELYTDSGRTAVWGNTQATGGGVTFAAGAGLTDPKTLTVYGQVPGAQNASAGNYSDSVTATVNY
jgi:spore coat protein U domain-containing protein, fimbrial subunit CupE1/2/3/6